MNFSLIKHPLFIYLAKFFAIFCIVYYGPMAVEGLAAPGNYYSAFVDHYLDYPSALRQSLLEGSAFFLKLMGYSAVITDAYHLQLVNGRWVQLIYACLGIGVMSFWLAFVVANKGKVVKKMIWVFIGLISIWLINVLRISLVLLANNRHAKIPFDLDNHTFFNILAYLFIFIMMYLYDKFTKRENLRSKKQLKVL